MSLKRSKNEQTLAQVLDRLIDSYRLGDKMKELDVVNAWEEVMGKVVAKRTTSIHVKDKILFVKVNSAPLKEELLMNKSRLVTLLNEKAGHPVIEDIRIF